MTYTDVTLGGIPLLGDSGDLGVLPLEAVVTNVIRDFLGAVRDTVEQIPGRAGSWSFDERPGDRTLNITVTLLTDSADERRAAIETLADWAERATPEPLIISDEPERYWDAKLSGMSDPEETVHTGIVELLFRAGPYSKALEPSTLDAPLSLVDGVAQDFELEDKVNADPIIELTADGGGFPSGLVLTVNGLELVFNEELAGSDTITISTVGFTVTDGGNADDELTGAFDENDLRMANVDGDFPELVAGTNTITVEGGNATAVITWRRRFRA